MTYILIKSYKYLMSKSCIVIYIKAVKKNNVPRLLPKKTFETVFYHGFELKLKFNDQNSN